MVQNHDILRPDAQQTFRLMHYFAVTGKNFPPGFPRVRTSVVYSVSKVAVMRIIHFTSITVPITGEHYHGTKDS